MNIRKLMAALLAGSVLVVSAVNAKDLSNGIGISKASVSEDNSTFNISAPDSAKFIEMSLQIKTEAGDVIFEENSQGDDLFFMVDASLPDGEYWYTVKTIIMLSREEQARTPSNPDHIIATEQSRFYVLGGYKVSENQYIKDMVRNPQAKNENAPPSFLLSLAGSVVDFFVGSAHADVTVTDGANGSPQIFFNDDGGVDDTTSPDADWELFGNAGGGIGFFRLRNNLGANQSSNIFGIDGSTASNGGMTLLIQEDGDVEFGGSRAAFTSSTTEPGLVIGSVDPSFSFTVNLELQDDTPYLLFHETGNGANAGLYTDGDAFILEGNNGGFQNIFSFDLLAPQSSLFVNSTGNVGFGTGAPAEAVDVSRSAAASRFQLTSYTNTGNEAAQFIQRRTRGTSAAPAALQSGDNLGLFSFRGYNGNSITGTKAGITVKATENWTPTANGTRLLFQTTQNGSTGLNTVMEITHDGKVRINGAELNVPDYVFEDDYHLMSLDELAAFIEENKHLPGVAAAGEVQAEGLDLAGSQLSVLEKVEELTLYTLQQHEALKQLAAENAQLKADYLAQQERLEKVDQLEQMVDLLIQRQENDRVLTSVNQ